MRTLLLAILMTAGLFAQDTTVVLVRHAEKASLEDPDTPLSAAGHLRAQALVPQLAAFHPTVLYASERQRTQQTLAPTAQHLGLKPLLHPSDHPETLAADILKLHRGKTVAIAWHHGPHEPLARALGVKSPLPVWTGSTFDRIWIIRVPPTGPARFEERVQAAVR